MFIVDSVHLSCTWYLVYLQRKCHSGLFSWYLLQLYHGFCFTGSWMNSILQKIHPCVLTDRSTQPTVPSRSSCSFQVDLKWIPLWYTISKYSRFQHMWATKDSTISTRCLVKLYAHSNRPYSGPLCCSHCDGVLCVLIIYLKQHVHQLSYSSNKTCIILCYVTTDSVHRPPFSNDYMVIDEWNHALTNLTV